MKVDYYLDSYQYFSRLSPNLNKGCLLDYGSNYGMFLDSSQGSFDQALYTGLDIDESALVEGRKQFPEANFIHYDGFNCTYNPTGVKGLRPILDKKFSNIISYSVFTHTTEDDMLDSVKWLYDQLEVGGKLMATFCSVNNARAVRYATKRRLVNLERFADRRVIYWFGDESSVDYPELGKMHFTFYDLAYLKTLLGNYNVKFIEAPVDVLNCFQECFVITKVLPE